MECGTSTTVAAGEAECAAEAAVWAALPPGCSGAWQAARYDAAPLVKQVSLLLPPPLLLPLCIAAASSAAAAASFGWVLGLR